MRLARADVLWMLRSSECVEEFGFFVELCQIVVNEQLPPLQVQVKRRLFFVSEARGIERPKG